MYVEVHRSARRHGVSDDDIAHATSRPLVVVDLDPEGDPPKILAVGPGNMLEVMVLELADGRLMAIHAMPLRLAFYDLLPRGEDSNA